MPQRTLIITECREIHRGRRRTGEEYVVYDVSATREDYTPIPDMKLRAFESLELHVPLSFEVRPYNTRSGMTYTLFPKGAPESQPKANIPQASDPQASDNYRRVIEAMEKMSRRILELERVVGEMLRDERPTVPDMPREQDLPI